MEIPCTSSRRHGGGGHDAPIPVKRSPLAVTGPRAKPQLVTLHVFHRGTPKDNVFGRPRSKGHLPADRPIITLPLNQTGHATITTIINIFVSLITLLLLSLLLLLLVLCLLLSLSLIPVRGGVRGLPRHWRKRERPRT